jgi:hypothetical protein
MQSDFCGGENHHDASTACICNAFAVERHNGSMLCRWKPDAARLRWQDVHDPVYDDREVGAVLGGVVSL